MQIFVWWVFNPIFDYTSQAKIGRDASAVKCIKLRTRGQVKNDFLNSLLHISINCLAVNSKELTIWYHDWLKNTLIKSITRFKKISPKLLQELQLHGPHKHCRDNFGDSRKCHKQWEEKEEYWSRTWELQTKKTIVPTVTMNRKQHW